MICVCAVICAFAVRVVKLRVFDTTGVARLQDELTEIATALQTPLGNASKHAILKLSEALFLAFDTDENLLVDALEVLVTLCLLSGMEPQAKRVAAPFSVLSGGITLHFPV